MSCSKRSSNQTQNKRSDEPLESEVSQSSHPKVVVQSEGSQTDFYQILGVSEDATYNEIKKKWLKLSLIYHPDKCDNNEDMFRKINLAYKVLSNPENRKKYNDSLAKTYDQLRDTERETNYKVNEEYLAKDETGKAEFDRNKFLENFERSRQLYTDLNDITPLTEDENKKVPTKSFDDILANIASNRDNDLENFKDKQRTKLVEERCETDQFNQVFNQYKLMTRSELEERVNSHELVDKHMAPLTSTFVPIDDNLVNQLAKDTKDKKNTKGTKDTEDTEDAEDQLKENVSDLENKMKMWRNESELLQKETEFENNLDNNDKVTMDSELLRD